MNDLLARLDPPRPLMSEAEHALYVEARAEWLKAAALIRAGAPLARKLNMIVERVTRHAFRKWWA